MLSLTGDLPAKPKKLGEKDYHVGAFDWSPDSKAIAFEHRPRPEADLARLVDIAEVEIASGTVRELAAEQVAESGPRYSPDGRYLAFTKLSGPREIDADRIALLARDTGAVRMLAP